MNIANFLKLLLVATLLAGSTTACRKGTKGTTPIYGRLTTPAPGSERRTAGMEEPAPRIGTSDNATPVPIPTNPDGSTQLGPRPADLNDYIQDRDTFKQDTVYFDFDKYNVRPSELSKAQSVAGYLKNQNAYSVLIEGHCDERGTPEYNRALGERRALSVRESLISLGIMADRVHTLSYGEDRPADTGHSESAYQKNRRGEFILLKPKAGGGAETR